MEKKKSEPPFFLKKKRWNVAKEECEAVFLLFTKCHLEWRWPPSGEEMSFVWDGHRGVVPATGSERPHTVPGEEEFL